MVAHSFSVIKKGMTDWAVQRVTALIMLVYFSFILFYWLFNLHMDFMHWRAFLLNPIMRVAGVISFLSLIWHAWIGIWTVLTDYIKNDRFRFFLQIVVWIALLGDAAWAIYLFLEI
jgi:succinate dehydrogenase / fumarate reductase, membrane anchor subunit